MRLGEMNNLSAEKLNENMQQRVGWNFGDLSRLTMAQATEMLETVDSKLQTIKTNNLHESEKNTAYNGMMLAKQVLEAFINEAAEEQVDEISKKTLGSYVKKATRDISDRSASAAMDLVTKNTGAVGKKVNKNFSREKGIGKATDRLTKESTEAGYTASERQVDQTFNTVMDRLLAMAKVMREDGALAVNVDGIGGDASYLRDAYKGILSAYDDVEEAHYGAMGHLHMDESTAQGVMEDEVGQAESLMAAQDMVDSVQGMLEDVGEMINEKLPPLTDSLRRSSGADSAATFNQQTNEALNTLMDAVRGAREAMANAVGTLTGQEPTPMGNTEQELDLDTATDDSEEFELDDFETSDAAQGGDEPLGRAKRD